MPDQNEKNFEIYCKVPFDARVMIANEMSPRDRCHFAECSKLSLKDAKSAKNYIYGLSFTNFFDGTVVITVFFSGNNEADGFKLLFEKRNGNCLSCKTMEFDELWKIEYDSSIDMYHFGLAHFKDLLNFYQNSIKMLRIDENNDNPEQIDYGIRSLKRLEKLEVHSKFDIRQFLSKIGHPLKEVEVDGIENKRIVAEWKKMYQVQNQVPLPDIQETPEQEPVEEEEEDWVIRPFFRR